MAAIAAGVVMVVLAVPEVQPRPDLTQSRLQPDLTQSSLQPHLPRFALAPPCRRTCSSAW